MTTWELIRKMVQKGYRFELGRHARGYRGYWASFFKTEGRSVCNECGELETVFWPEAGHAVTPHRAVVMASRIALNIPVAIPLEKVFKL